ncbi:hypothetical protein [Halobaculum sp. EA56]|uniref:hypothetical protein n=1 Tax=Halobaculum sp. EA56 TaxID=3421648 RepID=UPI003EBFD5BE
MPATSWPADPTHLTVRFPFAGRVLEGVVREAFLAPDVTGITVIFRVLVDGTIYRTTRREAEPIPDRY